MPERRIAGMRMLFFSSSLSGLIQWCRAFKHGLGAGLSLPKVFHLQHQKGPRPLREMALRIAERLEKGQTLEDSLDSEGDRLPKLFREMAGVGERTGHLPEIFAELGEYYELQQRLGREFRQQITLPIIQFIAAVVVIAFLIYVLGMIAEGRGDKAIAPIGFGLRGAKGAIIFLGAVGTFLGGLYAAYYFFTRGIRGRTAFEAFLLRLPAVGPCAEAFAMGRFCLSLRLTMETGMSPHEALKQAIRATGNAAYMAYEERIVLLVKKGNEIASSLQRCPVFSDEFIGIMAVAEVSGQIPEVMARQAEHYREEASRRLKTLARIAARTVYVFVAILMIIAIFKIANIYLGALGPAGGE